jgi:hypothetical protein
MEAVTALVLIKGEDFLDWLSDWKFLRNNSTPWS